jgi:hypothetical protein
MMMQKLSILVLLTTLTISCGKSGGGSSSDSAEANTQDAMETSEEIAADGSVESSDEDTLTGSTEQNDEADQAPQEPVPNDAITFETNITTYKFTSAGERKIDKAAALIKEVISSEEFKKKVLNHKVNGKKTFVDNQGLTNLQIYKRILAGSEKLKPAKDNEMDLEVQLYTDNSSNTVGYTYPSRNRVWMNSKYFNQNTPALVTTNMVHEWLHKLGFKHDAKSTPTRKYSVPYAVGYIVRDLAKQL